MPSIAIGCALLAVSMSASGGLTRGQNAVYDPATGGLTIENVTDLVAIRLASTGAALIAGQATDLDGAAAGTFGVYEQLQTMVRV